MHIVRRSALILLLPLLGCSGERNAAPIYLGVAGPLSASNGSSMRRAAEMAADEINRAGGVHGRRIVLVLRDDGAKPERAIELATGFRDDPRIVAVVGHVNSPATLAAAKIYNDPQKGLVQISPASSSPAVSDAGDWTFRVCPSDLQHGPALADWAFHRLGARRAAVLYANDPYGRGVLESFSAAFRQAGGEVIARDPYLPSLLEGEEVLDPYLRRAIRDGADALVVAGQADGGLHILKAARRLGYTGPLLGADGLTGVKDAGEVAEGVYISSAFLPDRQAPDAQEFVRAYLARYKELPDHRGAMAYDAVRLLARAMVEVGTDRVKLRDYLAGVGTRSPAFDGVSGGIGFDAKGDVSDKEVSISVVRGGRLVTASS